MIKNIFCSIALVLLGITTCIGQNVSLPAKCEAFKPTALIKDVLKESEINKFMSDKKYGQGKKPSDLKYWVVYSDRDNNTTYSDASTTASPYGSLTFNEQVRIAKIEGNWALVYSEANVGAAYPTIADATPKGWIPMDKLLLWSSCPANDKGIYYKALLSANLDNAKSAGNTLGKKYLNPENMSDYDNLTTDMNFYFIMKRSSDGLVLLSKQYKMEGQTDQVLFGWVNEGSYVAWNQRSCLEPNWDPEAVAHFSGKKVKVYGNSSLVGDGTSFAYGKTNGDDDEFSQYRMPASSLRFPILDNDTHNNEIYKCSSFSTGGADASEISRWQETINEGKRKTMNEIESVNLVIVIDGTKSMDPYFPAVKAAIKDGLNFFNNQDKVKVGVIIYRDYADGKNVVEVLPLCSPKEARFANFLDKGGEYGIKSDPKDITHTEALYAGINAVYSNNLGYGKKESNLMLVVGDCGNDLNDNKFKQEDLIASLANNNFQVLSFQVRNTDSQPWQLFNDQMSQIVKGTTQKLYSALGSIKTRFRPNADGYDLTPDDDAHRFFIGSTRRSGTNAEMSPKKLAELIISNLELFVEALDAGKNVVYNFQFGANEKSEGTFSIDEAFVKSHVSAEFWEAAKKSNSIMTFKGYTPKRDASDIDYWKPVVYISSSELDDLIRRLEPVNRVAQNATATSEDRKAYINAMKGILRSMVPDMTDEEMDRMGNSEVMNMISGLNESTKSLSAGPSLVDISEPKVVNDPQFTGLVHDFVRKYKKIKNIKGTRYKYSMEVNNTRYYWIPMEDLP